MTIKLTDLFDTYSLRARLQPAFLALLPGVIAAYLLWNPSGLEKLWPIFVVAGGTFLLANIVRSRGLVAQERLVREWNGLPTTQALRLGMPGNAVLRDRRRAQIEVLTGLRLPSLAEEEADPKAADDHYEAATRVLIAKVRDKSAAFPRVQDENTSYGFRRNLYALKPLALIIIGISLASCVSLGVRGAFTSDVAVTTATNMLALIAWTAVIRPEWVRQAGERYAERLLDALEDPSVVAPGT